MIYYLSQQTKLFIGGLHMNEQNGNGRKEQLKNVKIQLIESSGELTVCFPQEVPQNIFRKDLAGIAERVNRIASGSFVYEYEEQKKIVISNKFIYKMKELEKELKLYFFQK